jgi:hypothetical protein
MKTTAIILGILVLGVIGFFAVKLYIQRAEPVDQGIVCTMDAKICPDGSAVGRTGPNCEFALCPTSTDAGTVGYVSGHVTIGPFCPAERIDEPCTVPPEAYTSRNVVVYRADGFTIQEKVALDVQGKYRIALEPGTYWIQIQPAGIGPGEKKKVTVVLSETSVVDFDIDTGIR